MTPLHFRTTIKMNQGWLKRVFGGENQNIDSLQVPYGELLFQFVSRRSDAEYARSQFALILRVAAEYGGIGARLQHGFGQFVFPMQVNDITLERGIQDLQAKLRMGVLRSSGPVVETPFDLRKLVSLTFEISKSQLNAFTTERTHIGKTNKREKNRYIPCAFDLRYKGTGNFGMRQWLKGKGWKETTDPQKLEELDILLGPRSQWGRGNNQGQIDDDFRTASRVFFGMPYQKPESKEVYILRVWAFLPPELQHRLPTPQALIAMLEEYMRHVFDTKAQKISAVLGKDILEQGAGGTK